MQMLAQEIEERNSRIKGNFGDLAVDGHGHARTFRSRHA
jgi:hypothetical protein